MLSMGIAAAALTHRRDVFPLTALAGCWIALSTVWLAHMIKANDVEQFFLLTVWLTGSTAVAAKVLMHWLHQWREAAEGGAAS
jgi:hypothetical protein